MLTPPPNENDKRLFLLDAFALIYRAYYALINAPLRNSKGLNVSAIAGFINSMHELITKEKPTHMAVVFDAPDDQTGRAVEFSFYKANRQKMPEDIAISIPIIREIVKGFRIPVLEVPGYEADDIIGTLAKQKEKEGHIVYMVTPDKDFAQLVSENIFIYKPPRSGKPGEIMGVKEVLAKWEIEQPEQVIDILALWGDAVDNIPGIPGIGEKTAKKLVKQFGSVEGTIANVEELRGKQKENVIEFADQGMVSKQLATIILDVPIMVPDKDLLIEEPDKDKLAAIFAELEFRGIGRRILGPDFSINIKRPEGQMDMFSPVTSEIASVERGKNIENVEHKYQLVATPEARLALIGKLKKQEAFAFDTETTGLDAHKAEIVGMSFSFKANEGYYVPVPANFEEASALIQEFNQVFALPNALKIGQNIKYDLHLLRRYGVRVHAPIYDTMVAHYVCEPEKSHSLDNLSETFLGYTPMSIESLIGKKGKRQRTMRSVELDKITQYAAEDADLTFQLRDVMEPMAKERQVDTLLHDVEIPLIQVLEDMEYEGVALDVGFLNKYSKELDKELLGLQEKIFKDAGTEFNIDSPRQLGEILFDRMKIPYSGKKTKTGQYATSEIVLAELADEQPMVGHVLDYREIKKLKSTYVDALPELINPRTGRVHTTFSQAIAATGRLSSNNPNLQNIPIRTERGRHIRKAFVPRDKDHVILSADYSQIELRIIAALAGEKNMLEDFAKGLDIHTATAARVFGVAEADVTREMRGRSKAVNFGLIYGQGVFGLAQGLKIPRAEAKEIIDSYFDKYPKIREYMETNKEFAREKGYVMTILGRRRYLPEINSANRTVRGIAERNAINAPIQGSAADMIKKAMIDVAEAMDKARFQSKMTLQVHDELVFDARRDEVEDLKLVVIEKMQNAVKLDVPIVVEAGVGENWLEAH